MKIKHIAITALFSILMYNNSIAQGIGDTKYTIELRQGRPDQINNLKGGQTSYIYNFKTDHAIAYSFNRRGYVFQITEMEPFSSVYSLRSEFNKRVSNMKKRYSLVPHTDSAPYNQGDGATFLAEDGHFIMIQIGSFDQKPFLMTNEYNIGLEQ